MRNEVMTTQTLLEENNFKGKRISTKELRSYFIKGDLSISTYRNYIEVLKVLEYIEVDKGEVIFKDKFFEGQDGQ